MGATEHAATRSRWTIRRRLVFVISVAAATPAFAAAYWGLTWWPTAIPLPTVIGVLAVTTGAFAAVAVVFAIVVARGVLGPLEATTATLRSINLEDIAGRTQLDVLVIGADDPQEVAELKQAFLYALERISRDRLQREAVLGGLMHDLKTPIVAQAHLLDRVRAPHATSSTEVLDAANANAHSTLERLDQLIAVLRADAPPRWGSEPTTPLADVIDAVVARCRATHSDRVAVFVHGEGAELVDAEGVERALENVVSNAVRYASTRVDVEMHRGVVAVADDGPGFSIPFADAVDPFRPGPAPTRLSGTAGLGLYVARRTLEARGGRIALQESRRGRTCVLLYLPSEYV